MRDINCLIESITSLNQKLNDAFPDFRKEEEIFEETMEKFLELNVLINQSSTQGENLLQAKNRLRFLHEGAGHLSTYLCQTDETVRAFEAYVDFYLFDRVPPRRSAVEFLLEWYPELRTAVLSEELNELDQFIAHAGVVQGFDDKIPSGIPEAHWWWSYKGLSEHNLNFRR